MNAAREVYEREGRAFEIRNLPEAEIARLSKGEE
jgi:hypothetical protein